MLYILLTIIAVGVLLASEPGKKLLSWIIGSLLVGAGLWVCFLVVVFVIGLFSDKETRDGVATVLGIGVLIFAVIYYLYSFYKKYKNGDFKKEVLKKKAKNIWMENWSVGTGSKIAIVFIILAFSSMAILLFYSLTIKDFWQ